MRLSDSRRRRACSSDVAITDTTISLAAAVADAAVAGPLMPAADAAGWRRRCQALQ